MLMQQTASSESYAATQGTGPRLGKPPQPGGQVQHSTGYARIAGPRRHAVRSCPHPRAGACA